MRLSFFFVSFFFLLLHLLTHLLLCAYLRFLSMCRDAPFSVMPLFTLCARIRLKLELSVFAATVVNCLLCVQSLPSAWSLCVLLTIIVVVVVVHHSS